MDRAPVMTRRLTWLFAVASGAAVGNLYWAQPLLDFIAQDLHASAATAGWLVTATQVGYAAGILLIVPLGDVLNRRRLIPVMMLCAAAPSRSARWRRRCGVLLLAITALGMTTVAGQLLAPLAGDLADEADRGRVVGTVVSGHPHRHPGLPDDQRPRRRRRGLAGDLRGRGGRRRRCSRSCCTARSRRWRRRPGCPIRRSSPRSARSSAGSGPCAGRWSSASTGLRVFTLFWTSLTFLLSGPPFRYPVSVIGLFGLAGLAGAVAAQRAGRLHDRGWSLPATGAAWALALVAFVVAAFAAHSVVLRASW